MAKPVTWESDEGQDLAHVGLAIHIGLHAQHRCDAADCSAHHRRDVPAGRRESVGVLGCLGFVEHRDDHITRFVHREHTREARDVDRLAIAAVDQLLSGACLAADTVAGRIGLLAGALHYDQAQQAAHPIARILAEDALARRQRVVRPDLEQGRGMIDAAVEQRCIAHRQLQRRDRDALAKADGHGFERTPPRTRCERMSTLLELDRHRTEEAHLPEPVFLPLRAKLVGDLGGADVGAFLHDLGD